MPDIPDSPETFPGPVPDATLDAPTEVEPIALAAASRSEPGVADTARLLAEHFPALFGAGVIKPIKLRIQADIHQRAPGVFTKKALSMFLQRYTTATAYLRALVAEGATRIDLSGQPSGEIAAEHRDAAGSELERRRAVVDAKKIAGREAARARLDARPRQPPGSPPSLRRAAVSQPASPTTAQRLGTGGARPVDISGFRSPDRSPRPSEPGLARGRSLAPQPVERRGVDRTGTTGSGTPRSAQKPSPQRDRASDRQREPVGRPSLPMTQEEAAERDARQHRASLLRSFEQSPLSKTNFGALKGLSEAALDALLNLARQERN